MHRVAAILVLITCTFVPLSAQRRKPAARPAAPADAAAPGRPAPSAAMLKPFTARSIGPAVMGGRVSDVAFDPKDPWTFYVATAHGGLMKTTNNGGTFTALTDKVDFSWTGAVAVAPSDP
jgi:hypothetical protein